MLCIQNCSSAFVSLVLATTTIPFAFGAEQRNKTAAPASSSTPAPADDAIDAVTRYCTVVGASTSEQRVQAQLRRLETLGATIDRRVAELEAKEASARSWMEQRETALRKATEDVIAIYGKMRPEAAAAQLAELEEEFAAAILAKLNPRVASTILNDMNPANAAKLVAAIARSKRGEGKKS